MVHVDEKYMRRITYPFKLVNPEEYYGMPEKERIKLESEVFREMTKIFILNLHNFDRESKKRNSTIRYKVAV